MKTKEITIDILYDLMRSYVIKEQRRPTHLLLHPTFYRQLEEIDIITQVTITQNL